MCWYVSIILLDGDGWLGGGGGLLLVPGKRLLWRQCLRHESVVVGLVMGRSKEGPFGGVWFGPQESERGFSGGFVVEE